MLDYDAIDDTFDPVAELIALGLSLIEVEELEVEEIELQDVEW